MSEALNIESATQEQTEAVGRALGAAAAGGEFLALIGELGAGKTVLVRALARGLDLPADEPVTSPTFVLMAEYAARLRLVHIDAYRLSGADAFRELGALPEPPDDEKSIVAIEWADRVGAAMPDDRLNVTLEHRSADRRGIAIQASGTRARAWLERARAQIPLTPVESTGTDP